MRAIVRTLLVCIAGCASFALSSLAGAGLTPAAIGERARRAPAATRPSLSLATSRGIEELIGAGRDHSPVAWDPKRGLWWSRNIPPHWWQSALALRTLVRYLERTGNTASIYEDVIRATYERNVLTPHAAATTNFVNKYLDDTAWWGLAWLEAARYELRYRRDLVDAETFLHLAEWDATAIADTPRSCGGVRWRLGSAPDTIANAEYTALAAELYGFRSRPGIFADPQLAARWLSEARGTLKWLIDSRLVNIGTGVVVADKLSSNCRRRLGGPMTYTEGEVADALTQLGIALHNVSYFKQAARFLSYAIRRWSPTTTRTVLSEPCERANLPCELRRRRFNLPAYKGILVQAVDDWSLATRSHAYRSFLLAQGAAIIEHDISDGDIHAGTCATAHTCQFGFYWGLSIVPGASSLGVTVGTQTTALDALIAAGSTAR